MSYCTLNTFRLWRITKPNFLVKIPSGGPNFGLARVDTMAARSTVRHASFFQRLHTVAIRPEV